MEAVFGNADPDRAATVVSDWCGAVLGSRVETFLFSSFRLGSVWGARLADGRTVVVKVHRPSEDPERLQAVFDVQAHLWNAGFPCPRPLLPPRPLGHGTAIVEAALGGGPAPDGHDARVRGAMAEGLARQTSLTRDVEAPAALVRSRPPWIDYRSGGLWPPIDHPALDFESIDGDIRWIDDLARRAKAHLLALPRESLIVGHSDYEAHNVRVARGSLEAVYDWDSLVDEREDVVVGVAAAVFTAHPDPGLPDAPSKEERRLFVHEYESVRGAPFTSTERAAIDAASTWATAFNARLQHAFEPEKFDSPGSFARALHGINATQAR